MVTLMFSTARWLFQSYCSVLMMIVLALLFSLSEGTIKRCCCPIMPTIHLLFQCCCSVLMIVASELLFILIDGCFGVVHFLSVVASEYLFNLLVVASVLLNAT